MNLAAKPVPPEHFKVFANTAVWWAAWPNRVRIHIDGLVTKSEANLVQHWAKKHQRRTPIKTAVDAALRAVSSQVPLPMPKRVVLRRIGKQLLDDDNLRSALKWARDSVAERYVVNDGPKGPIKWDYDQAVGTVAVELDLIYEVQP